MGKVINFFEAVKRLKEKKAVYITPSTDFNLDFIDLNCYKILSNEEYIIVRTNHLNPVKD